MRTQVQCYSGYIYAERPDSFRWQGKVYQVQRIVKEWQEPGERHFQVRTTDNLLFELCYSEQEDEWLLTELAGKEKR